MMTPSAFSGLSSTSRSKIKFWFITTPVYLWLSLEAGRSFNGSCVLLVCKNRDLVFRDGKPEKIAESKGEIKNTDCRHTLNPCEQSITKTTNHRPGNSTILLELNSLSRLNYSVHSFFSPSRVCKSCQGKDCQIRRQIRREVFSSLFLKF